MIATDFYWLLRSDDWDARLKALVTAIDPCAVWAELVSLAKARIDPARVNRLDKMAKSLIGDTLPETIPAETISLAVLASSTATHLLPGLRIAAMRRGIWLKVFVGDYNQYYQSLLNPASSLIAFAPRVVLCAFDAVHITQGLHPLSSASDVAILREEKIDHVREIWRLCRERFDCSIIQQSILPIFDPLLGGNESRLPGSRARFVHALNEMIREAAMERDIDILGVDEQCLRHGTAHWHEPMLWLKAKQEIAPAAAPYYGDLALRLIGARRGRSFKALVLDLDNTLWGGVVGDDGPQGIVLGNGSAYGESFLALQAYAKDLSARGVILAVCSKNDAANARSPFIDNPDMVLRLSDITSFVANWDDKARNIRLIAHELNIGLDAVVFVDDNPFERNLVRTELPMVAVPEVPDEPILVARCLSDAGYFESTGLTAEDRERAAQYRANTERTSLAAAMSDMNGYLRDLRMRLLWREFDDAGLPRTVQLINKTNQFNLTTKRYSDGEIGAVRGNPDCFGLQFRLLDRFGDNGMIAVVIGRRRGNEIEIDTWLMSCRVLGREVEIAILGVIIDFARAMRATRLIGIYKPSAKNGMVADHYAKLGFTPISNEIGDGRTMWTLDLASRGERANSIEIVYEK